MSVPQRQDVPAADEGSAAGEHLKAVQGEKMKIKGFTYGYDGKRGDYRTPEAALSMDRLPAHTPEMGFSIVGKKAEETVKAWYGNH